MRMRPDLVSVAGVSGVLALLVGGLGAPARAQEAPVMDSSEVGPVIVYDNGPQQAPQRGGTLTVIPNNAPPDEGLYWYFGPHPDALGNWEATEGAHAHDYAPFDSYLFAEEDGYYYFIGDPGDFGYGGSTFPYYGVHPVPVEYGGGYCYCPGYHHHLWQPVGRFFALWSGWYAYRGPFSPTFYQYQRQYNDYYRGVYYPTYRGPTRSRPNPTTPVQPGGGTYGPPRTPVMSRGFAPGVPIQRSQPGRMTAPVRGVLAQPTTVGRAVAAPPYVRVAPNKKHP